MGNSKLTNEDKALIRQLWEQGHSYVDLAERFGVATATIMRTCRPEKYQKHMESVKSYNEKNGKQIYKTRKSTAKKYSLSFHMVNDAKIIEQLDKQENIKRYIRSLVEQDIDKSQESELM